MSIFVSSTLSVSQNTPLDCLVMAQYLSNAGIRTSITTNISCQPELLIADEPTGNLDPKTADAMMDLMLELNQEWETTLIVVTHSQRLASRFPRNLSLQDGRFMEQA